MSLLADYKLNDQSLAFQDLFDSLGLTEITGDYGAGVTEGVAGLIYGDPDTAVTGDRTTEIIDSAQTPDLDAAWSLGVWINTSYTSVLQSLFSQAGSQTTSPAYINVTTGELISYFPTGTTRYSGINVADGDTHLCILTFSGGVGGTLRFYVDGVAGNSVAGLTGGGADGNLVVGARHDKAAHYFDGSMHKPFYLDRALTSTEIRNIYTRGRFIAGQVMDLAGSNHLTVNGSLEVDSLDPFAETLVPTFGDNKWLSSGAYYLPATDSFRFQIWFKRGASVNIDTILWQGASTGRTQIALRDTGYLTLAISGSTVFNSDSTWDDDLWHLLVLTRSGSIFTFYVDGVEDGSGTSAASISQATNDFRVGTGSITTAGFPGNLFAANLQTGSSDATADDQTGLASHLAAIAARADYAWGLDAENINAASALIRDYSGNQNHLIDQTGIQRRVTGATGVADAIAPDDSDYATTSLSLSGKSAYTIEGAIYVTDTDDVIFDQRDGAADGVALLVTTGGVLNAIHNAVTGAGTTDIRNAWHHVAVTWDGTTLRVYIDGIEEDNDAVATALAITAEPTLFADYTQAANNFDGSLQHIRIWDEAQSAAWVAARSDEILNGLNVNPYRRVGYKYSIGI